ncbi:hypothetical protein JWV26_10355 [Ectopseudomonas toyotomiensis]|uniref:Lipoprotein n=1 Tax=Ectopseudomonas toyotomiensis TaxID=554344 RepID=A0ABD7E1Y5_9GAMM|nr:MULTISPECIES: hypothetical protein [Pseudomonas]AQZ35764.1 hypothetical protein BHQ29_22380 [Pseudomonas sp. LPH1]QSL94725.1 hypothetical protein JWV26_10355 [Pseudomonas toyotomiensis]
MRTLLCNTLLASALVSLSACAEQGVRPSVGITQAEFAGQAVQLSDAQGRCALTLADAAPLTLDMQWPCRFSETPQQQLRVEYFRQTPIIMVERSEPQPAPSRSCLTDLQALRLHQGRLEAAPVSRIAACGPSQWDQKAFVGMFDW